MTGMDFDQRVAGAALLSLALASIGCAGGESSGPTTFGPGFGSTPPMSTADSPTDMGESDGDETAGDDDDDADSGDAESGGSGGQLPSMDEGDDDDDDDDAVPGDTGMDPGPGPGDTGMPDPGPDPDPDPDPGGPGQPDSGMWAHCTEADQAACLAPSDGCLFVDLPGGMDGFCTASACANPAADCGAVPAGATATATCIEVTGINVCALECTGATCPAGMLCTTIALDEAGMDLIDICV